MKKSLFFIFAMLCLVCGKVSANDYTITLDQSTNGAFVGENGGVTFTISNLGSWVNKNYSDTWAGVTPNKHDAGYEVAANTAAVVTWSGVEGKIKITSVNVTASVQQGGTLGNVTKGFDFYTSVSGWDKRESRETYENVEISLASDKHLANIEENVKEGIYVQDKRENDITTPSIIFDHGSTKLYINSVTITYELFKSDRPDMVLKGVAPVADGYYYIRNVETGKFLKCASTDLIMASEVDGNADLFKLEAGHDGRYYIQNSKKHYITWGLAVPGGAGALNVDNTDDKTTYLGERDFCYIFAGSEDGYSIYYEGTTLTSFDAYLQVTDNQLTKGSDNNSTWVLIPPTEVDMVIGKSAPYGTFCAPYNVTMPTGVDAKQVSAWDSETGKLTLTTVAAEGEVLAAGTPVIIEGATITKTFKGLATINQDENYDGFLTGLYPGYVSVPADSYVLSKKADEAKFYKTNGGNGVAYRAYLTVPSGATVKSIAFADSATAVKSIENANVTVSSIYSVSGAKSNTMQKGINVVKYSDGSIKKVFVK